MLPLALACQSDGLTRTGLADAEALYWDLRLDHRAVTLSTVPPYDTLTVAAVPRNQFGVPLSDLPAPEYISTNPERVLVTAGGVLRAVAVTTPATAVVPVVAMLTYDNLKHIDTVFVKVTAVSDPPRLDSFSIHPLSPDSAKVATLGAGGPGLKTLRPRLLDSNGVTMSSIPVAFWSSDPATVRIQNALRGATAGGLMPGAITGLHLGTATIYASTTVYGITKVDTLPYRVGYPITQLISLTSDLSLGDTTWGFHSNDVTVGVGGLVFFYGLSLGETPSPAADVVFDDEDLPNVAAGSTFKELANRAAGYGGVFPFSLLCLTPSNDCRSGNGMLPAGGGLSGMVMRVFAAPGIYPFHSTALGLGGRIVVVDER